MIFFIIAILYILGLFLTCAGDYLFETNFSDTQLLAWPLTLLILVPIRTWKYWSKVVRDELKR